MKKFRFTWTGLLKYLLVLVFVVVCVLFVSTQSVKASTVDTDLGTSTETGTTEDRTNIREPGSTEDPDDLKELNISNDLTVTYSDGNGSIAGALRIMLILTGITLAPILIICLTSFTRILIVLHFTRAALNTQTAPPNQILIALALFLTFFIMNPTITKIYDEAIVPFENGTITQEEALSTGVAPLRDFMYAQTQTKDAKTFCDIGGYEWTGELDDAIVPFENGTITQEEALSTGVAPLRDFMYAQTQTKDAKTFCDIGGYEWTGELDDIPTSALIPAFMVSELRTAFIIGFVIYIPFIVIDMVVASALMSMGMMMLPPTTISMPFKILLFVMADGWNLVIVNLVKTFY